MGKASLSEEGFRAGNRRPRKRNRDAVREARKRNWRGSYARTGRIAGREPRVSSPSRGWDADPFADSKRAKRCPQQLRSPFCWLTTIALYAEASAGSLRTRKISGSSERQGTAKRRFASPQSCNLR